MGKLSRLMRSAKRRGTLDAIKPMWVTEVAFDSSPPDPDGVPAMKQARWLAQTYFVLWRQGVSAVFWFQVQDSAPVPSYAATNQGGVFLLDGRAKPSARAFAFPVVTTRRRVWTRAPAAGTLIFERRSGRRWKVLRTLTVSAGQVVYEPARLTRGAKVRARLGSRMSLVWRVA